MTDMTVGRPRTHLWRYALPLLLGNWLQLSYNAVDAMIAGRFIGRDCPGGGGHCRAGDESGDSGDHRTVHRGGNPDERSFRGKGP